MTGVCSGTLARTTATKAGLRSNRRRAGLGGATAGSDRSEEDRAARQARPHAVTESRPERRCQLVPPARRLEPGIKRDPAERHDHADAPQQIDFGLEIWTAAQQLVRRRLVVRRGAAGGGVDVAVAQAQALVPRAGRG